MNSAFDVHDYRELRNVSHLCWESGDSRYIFRNWILNILSTRYTRDDGRSGDYLKIDCADWVNICALHKNARGEDCLVMVRQFRHGSNTVALEVPGGVIDAGESSRDAALRELHEETGFRAGTIEHIGSSSPNAALMGNRMHVFLAQNLGQDSARSLDKNEVIDVELVPVSLLENGAVPEFLVNGIMTISWYYFSIWMKGKTDERI